jgi:hypothetical protein
MVPCMAQLPRTPDAEAQRAAMKKLSFLIGKWSGEARVFRGPEPLELIQTEEAQYKLDGLLLIIEASGHKKSDGNLALQAYGIISYDDETKTYRFRAYNDGRWLESEVKLLEDGKGLSWGFSLGAIKTNSRLLINDRGEWTELHEIAIGEQAPQKFMELVVRPRN